MQQGKSLSESAIKAGMDEKTARKYLKLRKQPSECRPERNWITWIDLLADVWDEIEKLLKLSPDLRVKTIFDDLARQYPGRYPDGQIRTLQRKLMHTEGFSEGESNAGAMTRDMRLVAGKYPGRRECRMMHVEIDFY